MAKATLFSPITKERRAIEIGSPEEKQLFSQGFKLETPTQNLKTWDWNAPKQISTGDRGALFSTDATGNAPIADQSQLSQNVVSGGYQDTRRPMGFEGEWGAEAAGYKQPSEVDVSGNQPGAGTGADNGAGSANMVESFNNAVSKLLLGLKEGNLDKDLIDQRNELIQQRFNNTNEQTPGAEANLTPQQQSSLRSQRERALETQLSGVTGAMESRALGREEYRDVLNIALDAIDNEMQYAKDDLAAQNTVRDDARASLQFLLKENPDLIRAMSTSEKTAWEKAAGYLPGTLAKYDTTQTETEKKADKDGDESSSKTVQNYADYLVKNFGGTITQTPYGGVTHGNLNAYDVALKAGTSLHSPFTSGTVVAVGNFPERITTATGTAKDYGNYVDIKDDATGRIIRFGHLSQVNVGEGDKIDSLATFGLSGNSGLALGATGNHVHIEERNAGSFAPQSEEKKKETTGKSYDEQKKELESSKGDDGFVNSDTYKKLRSELKTADERSQFDSNFAWMLNPQDQSVKEYLPEDGAGYAVFE